MVTTQPGALTPQPVVGHLNELRRWEIRAVEDLFPRRARILEIGAGTGAQAAWLAQQGFNVEAVDLVDSNYAAAAVFPVQRYDGVHLPWTDHSFDVVYTSNVLEHIKDLGTFHKEVRRVLATGGRCIHVVPTHTWRVWTSLEAPIAALTAPFSPRRWGTQPRPSMAALRRLLGPLLPRRHGERGTVWSEIWLYHPSTWRSSFKAYGLRVDLDRPVGLFYAGHDLFGDRLSLRRRAQLARRLGSACHVFVLRQARGGGTGDAVTLTS